MAAVEVDGLQSADESSGGKGHAAPPAANGEKPKTILIQDSELNLKVSQFCARHVVRNEIHFLI